MTLVYKIPSVFSFFIGIKTITSSILFLAVSARKLVKGVNCETATLNDY